MKKYEFWNPRVFELPYYFYLAWRCLISWLSPKQLVKANYALFHGEIGLGSKYETQLAFDQRYFMPTELIPAAELPDQKFAQIQQFANKHGYPVMLKSDVGCVGKGICKVTDEETARKKAKLLLGDYLLQKYCEKPFEAGIFFVRLNGQPHVTGINVKHFPSVVGNGQDDILTLARRHQRFTHHWHAFLQNVDTSEVLADGVEKRLSFIGSHTLGCRFTDDRHLATPELRQAVYRFFESQPGYNFGRLDVRADNEEALIQGEFVVIEVNGIASIPTHLFDPKYSVWQAWGIFLKHARFLVRAAKENQHQPMEVWSVRRVINRIRSNQAMLNRVHARLMGNAERPSGDLT